MKLHRDNESHNMQIISLARSFQGDKICKLRCGSGIPGRNSGARRKDIIINNDATSHYQTTSQSFIQFLCCTIHPAVAHFSQLWSPCPGWVDVLCGSTIYQPDDKLLICAMFAVLYHFVNDIIFYLQILFIRPPIQTMPPPLNPAL